MDCEFDVEFGKIIERCPLSLLLVCVGRLDNCSSKFWSFSSFDLCLFFFFFQVRKKKVRKKKREKG